MICRFTGFGISVLDNFVSFGFSHGLYSESTGYLRLSQMSLLGTGDKPSSSDFQISSLNSPKHKTLPMHLKI